MAPSHLSVREMREDEKPLVLEMLKVRGRGPRRPGSGCNGGIASGFSPPLPPT
ncbi:NAT14 isoform 2 [Pongo abelii]|uniref:NAT14 isoform 2 n=1 Tax=Pongo abelii TaxID=9601 RepID=A0A2J8R3G2_PONAB|nr:NAT14 isoform 2 [Pongo abelii]